MENVQNKFLKAALWYCRKGFSVIPCKPKSKEALVPWTQYQKQPPTEEQVRTWWTQNPDANIAIVLGKASNIITLEVDDEKAINGHAIPVTPQAISGGKGLPHIYFRYVGGMKNHKAHEDGRELFSIRGDGQYVLAPPSIHPSGNSYKWVYGLRIDRVEPAEPPDWVLGLITGDPAKEEAERHYKQKDGKHDDNLGQYITELKSKVRLSNLLIHLGIEKTEEKARYSQFNCPFHQSEGKKSFTAWDDIGVGKDWHDEKTYDCIELVRANKGLGFKEALNFLSDYAGVEHYNFSVDGRVVEQSELEESHTQADITEIQFPEEAWIGLFGDYRTLVEPTTEAPVSFHFGSIATILGARLKRSVYVSYGGNLYPNVFAAEIGRTGTEKKDTAINRARNFFSRDELLIEVVGTGSAEGLLQCFMDEETEVTGQRAKVILKPVEGRCLLFTEYEFSRFLSKSSQKGSNLLTTFTQLYDCPDEYSPPTRSNRIIAIKPVLSFLTGSTLASCEKHLNDEHVGSGFLNRFMFFIDQTDKLIPFPPKPDSGLCEPLRAKIEQIIKWAGSLPDGEIKVSPEAQACWEGFYPEWQTKRRLSNPLLADMWSRIPNHIWKIAMLYAVSDRRQEISQDDLELAILVGDYLEKTSAIIVSHLAKSKTTKIEEYILNKLQKVHPYGLTKTQIHHHVGGKINVTALEKTLDGLKKMQLIAEVEVKGKDGKGRSGYVAVI